MIGNELLALLSCPETRQPLVPAPAELLAKLESERAAGRLRNRAGNAVAEPVLEGLLRADGAVLYPIRDGIALLLTDDGIIVATP